MKHAMLGLTLLTLAVGACAPVRDEVSSPATENDLLAANAEYDRAIIEADRAALDRIYATDFSFVGDKAELRNKDAQIRHLTSGSIRLLYAQSDDIAVRRLGPSHALLIGRFTGRYRAGSNEISFVERYSSVWTREGSRWRLRHEHSSFVPESDR
jgi:ketosteroid isomerase-like protein